MDDIIFSMPFDPDDVDLLEKQGTAFDGWAMRHYWMYDDGTFSVCDSDGNHVDIDQSEIPNADMVCAAWLTYSRFVAKMCADPDVLLNACDPLREFLVKHERKTVATFYFRGFRSIIGPKFMVKRKGDRTPYRSPETYGKDVAAFFTCESLDEISPSDSVTITKRTCNASSQVTAIRGRARVELRTKRSERTIRRELREIATRHFQREPIKC
jgi:hypothetical protein